MIAHRVTSAALLAVAVCALGAACSGDGAECRVDDDCPVGSFCQDGDCAYDCVFDRDCPQGFRCNARGRCERGCVESNGGVEACDGLDNDCDGRTDEEWPELGTACSNGGCPEGLWVCTADGAGMECDGPRPADDDATCDGVDDDCDGATDDDVETPRSCPLQEGLCAGTEQHCRDGAWSRCDYGPDYTAGVDARCDGVDEDCDGATDEDAAVLPVAELGVEADDGLDNNCSGVADEPGGVMVPIGLDVAIDAYEAVLAPAADCSGAGYGLESDDYPPGFPAAGQRTATVYACSLPGRLPSGYVSWYRAQWACQAQGKRLCSGAEWRRACAGGQSLAFPYGQYLVPAVCNIGYPEPGGKAATGDFADCTNDFNCYDMSGNVLEWVADDSDFGPDSALVAGGAYYCQLCDDGARCRPCRTDGTDEFEVDKMVNCYPDPNRDYESYPRATAEPFMGARCCWDIP